MSNETKAAKKVDQGVATIMHQGSPIFAITRSEDGTFGWRSHGQMTVKGRDGADKASYKFRKGFESAQVAIAASLCYLARHTEVDADKLEVVDYVAPERKGLPNRKLQDTEQFAEALKLTKRLKIPATVKKAMAA